MRELVGDLWALPAGARCITTNGIVKSNGEAVMGAGVALSAKQRYPDLPRVLGRLIRQFGNHVHYVGYRDNVHLYSFPTKNDWRDPSDPELIERSARELRGILLPDLERIHPVVMTRPGCGNGGLDWAAVRPIMEKELPEDEFVIVELA